MTGSSSRAIWYLLGRALVELATLPLHLIAFFARRRAIRREIRELLERRP